jgi:hypothetical protein
MSDFSEFMTSETAAAHPRSRAAGHPRRRRMKTEPCQAETTSVEYVCPLSQQQSCWVFKNNKISLVRKNGEQIDDILAAVQGEKIITDNISLIMEEGDEILRILPNGVEEKYTITNLEYNISDLFQGMEHVIIHVRKETQIDSRGPSNQQFNIYGNNSQMNINSPNANLNNINITCAELFENLRCVIDEKITDENAKSKLLNQVDELEKVQGEKSFSEKYTNFIASAANHATLWSALSPFIPAFMEIIHKI